MALVLRFSYILFLLGFVLKFFHIHYNALMMMAGLTGAIIVTTIMFFHKEKNAAAFLHTIILLWLIQLLVTVKFFPIGNMIIWIAIGMSAIYSIYLIRQKQFRMIIPVLSVALVAIYTWSMSLSERYKLLNINWNHEIDTDHITWDKYSWFLYKDGKSSEALEASDEALRIAVEQEDTEWQAFIEEHNRKINDGSWTTYR
jgi:hypothetical protein